MFSIHLNNLKFFAYHGVYAEEKILGGYFEVNTVVDFKEQENITTLEQTIDYTKIFDVIKQRMAQPTALLETVAQHLADLIYAVDRRIIGIDIKITKLHPPIEQFSGNLSVSFKKVF
jgi:7,8-dihydroneopterin aldolase/epimerase/oxygenase